VSEASAEGTRAISEQYERVRENAVEERERATGKMWVFVDGLLDAEGDGPGGDVSYPDDAASASSSDPYLVLGAEKHDQGAAFPSYDGYLDEVRISKVLRYAGPFTRPKTPFTSDADKRSL